jgi:hypothetical protein
MKNKVFSAVLCSVLAAGALSSCTNSFEDWNINPNEVTPDEMLQDNLATGANYSTMQRGVFTVGKDNGGTYQITQMLTGDIFAGYFADLKGTYNIGNLHLDHYYMVSHWYNMPFAQANTRIMEPYRQICTFADENSVDRAMATVVRVFGMHRITDKYGPIIYSKFGTDVQAGYDSQEAIYKSFFEELDHAIEILGTYVDHNPGVAYMESYDNVYYGDVARWVKFANTLRLRLAMRVSYVNKALATEQANAAINESHGLMSSTSDDAYLHQGNGLTFTNSIWEVTQSWADLGMSATADCYLNGYNDPRLEKYYVKNSDGAFRGARNGVVNPQSALLQTKVSAGNFNQGSDQPWMFSAEAYFLQAEAKLRLGVGNSPQPVLQVSTPTSRAQLFRSHHGKIPRPTALSTFRRCSLWLLPLSTKAHQKRSSSSKSSLRSGLPSIPMDRKLGVKSVVQAIPVGFASTATPTQAKLPKTTSSVVSASPLPSTPTTVLT